MPPLPSSGHAHHWQAVQLASCCSDQPLARVHRAPPTEIEGVMLCQDVDSRVEDTDDAFRLFFGQARVADLSPVQGVNGAVSHHLEALTMLYHDGRIFVDTKTQVLRVLRHRPKQT